MSASQTGVRLLVIAAQRIAGNDVIAEIGRRAGDGAEVRLVAPALAETSLENLLGDVDEARAAAEKRLEQSRKALAEAGIETSGEVGDSDLRLAIQDALQTFDADEIVIVAHDNGGPAFEKRGIEEAEREFEPPITELYVGSDGDTPRVTDTERVGPGKHPPPDERESRSGNLPRFSPRDVAGIIVAIVGTVVLVVLAADTDELSREGQGFGGFGDADARLLIAGAMALINLAHIVGLVLFQSGPYRGWARTFFARLSLFGTPLAILVSALLLA